MALEYLNELSTDESSRGQKTDEAVVDYVVSAIHTRFMKKNKNQVQREEKKNCLVSQISEESLYEQMENFADLLRVTFSLYDAREIVTTGIPLFLE
jgi:hypothetical protein